MSRPQQTHVPGQRHRAARVGPLHKIGGFPRIDRHLTKLTFCSDAMPPFHVVVMFLKTTGTLLLTSAASSSGGRTLSEAFGGLALHAWDIRAFCRSSEIFWAAEPRCPNAALS